MSASTTLIPYDHFLLHAALSASAVLLSAALNLPVRALQGIHTYIHPDSVAGGGGLRAAIRRPEAPAAEPKRRGRSKDHRSVFDESDAQLFRLRLADSHLRTRLFFSEYRAAFLSSVFSLSVLALRLLLPPDTDAFAAVPAVAALLSAAHILFSLAKTSLERSASRRSEKQLSLLSGFLGFLAALLIAFLLSPSVFDIALGQADSGLTKAATAVVAGCLAGLLFVPAARAARSFWLGTDQLRWNLSVVSCGAPARVLLLAAILLSVAAPLLWINPVAAALAAGEERSNKFEELRVWALMASAALQLLVLRPNLQTYLNEAVLCWYQRLHASREPDLDYGRAKVFLHNHYLCLTVLQFFAPPVLVLLLLGLSQMRGNLFSGALFIAGLEDFSAPVKEMALFLAWWIMFAWAILTMLSLALYRCGFLFVS